MGQFKHLYLAIIVAFPSILHANDIFWTSSIPDLIEATDSSGSSPSSLINIDSTFGSFNYEPRHIAVQGNNLVWVDPVTDSIYRSNINGSSPNRIIDINN
ncbi:MAG: hypothetical protein AAFY98_09865, partial [Verrucomicrobiota bacterium]